LRAGVFDGDRAARIFQAFGIIRRQVRADLLPGLAEVCGLEDDVAGEPHGVLIVWRLDDGRVPVETVFLIAGSAAIIARLWADRLLLARAEVRPHNSAALRF